MVAMTFALSLLIQTGSEDSQLTKVEAGPVTFHVPKSLQVQKTTPVEDFDLITISDGDKRIVTAYLGNHPDFPRLKGEKGDLRESQLGDAIIITKWKDNELIRKEMKVALSAEFPMFLHIYSAPSLTNEEVRMADKILSSIVVKKKR